MADEASEAGGSPGEARAGAPGVRIDWRSGKSTVHHDDAFWLEHERRRRELGLSVRQYCAAHALALSTYRHRLKGGKRSRATSVSAAQAKPSSSPAFVAIATHPAAAAAPSIEVALGGMTMRLCGDAAERVLARVLERLA